MSCCYKLSQNSKKKISLGTTLFQNFGYRIVFTLGGFGTYIISYLIQLPDSQNNLTMSHSFFFFPLAMLIMTLSYPISGFLEKQFGLRITLIISCVWIELSLFLFFICKTYLLTQLTYLLLGVGLGLSGMLLTKNTCYYFPENRGLVTSFITAFSSLSPAAFNFIGESIINPDSKGGNDEGLYPFEIAKNYKNFIFLICILIPIVTFVTIVILIFTNADQNPQAIKDNKENKKSLYELPMENKENLINKQGDLITNEEDKAPSDNNINNESNLNSKNLTYKQVMIKILTSCNLYYLLAEVTLLGFCPFLIQTTNRVIGLRTQIPQKIVIANQISTGLILGFFGPVWGFFYDKFGFRLLMIIYSIISILTTIIFMFSIGHIVLFMIDVMINSILISGVQSLFVPHIMKVYSMKYCMEVSGIIGIGLMITNIIGAVLAFILTTNKSANFLTSIYIIYGIGLGIMILGFVLLLIEKLIHLNWMEFHQGENIENNKETLGLEREGNENNEDKA